MTKYIHSREKTSLEVEAASGDVATSSANVQEQANNKVDLQSFSGEEKDWSDWRKTFLAHVRMFGFASGLPSENEIKVDADDFNDKRADPARVKTTSKAWLALI